MDKENYFEHNGIVFSVLPCLDQMLDTGMELYVGQVAPYSGISLPNAIYGHDRNQVIKDVSQKIDEMLNKVSNANKLTTIEQKRAEKPNIMEDDLMQ